MIYTTDEELGKKVGEYLVEMGVETPRKKYCKEEEKEDIAYHFAKIMTILGLDLDNDSLSGTPKRIKKMFENEVFYGLDYKNFPSCTVVENTSSMDNLVVEKDIAVKSMCEHHFLPIIGTCKVGYLASDNVIGLSKINRIVDFFSRRPQIQERLTEQIFHTLCFILDTEDVAVIIDAKHTCVSHRGIQQESSTATSRLGGAFIHGSLRHEFMHL